MKESITIHDIARELNISSSTVSRALQDHPRISPKTRKRVRDLAKQYGYYPNRIASSLRSGKSPTVGIVVPRIDRNFFANIIGGIEDSLEEKGFNIVICQSNENYKTEISKIQSLLNLQVDALFISLAATSSDKNHIRELADTGKKLILFDRVVKDLPVPRVVADDYKGAYDMVSHMIRQGYRKIHHFAGPAHLPSYQERLKGFRQAMEENNLKITPGMVHNDSITRETGWTRMLELLSGSDKPEAVFCASDFSALGSLLAIREKGIEVPGGIGVAGFANEPFTEFLIPGISSVDQKARSMGQKIAEIYLDEQYTVENRKEIILPEICIRNSTLRN